MPRALAILLLLTLSSAVTVPAQSGDARQRAKAVRDYAKQGGQELIPRLAPYLDDADTVVRQEAVKAIVAIGGGATLAPLIKATRDNDSEVQFRATDGLVNFYLPGYVKPGGLAGSLQRVGGAIKAKFNEQNDTIIEAYVEVRPEVHAALGALARGGNGMDVRANAARAIGILRGKPAMNDLFDALRSKDTQLIYESIMALQKIRDRSAGPRIQFLLRDLDEGVQVAAIETTGILQNASAARDVRDVIDRTGSLRVRRAALTALAMLAAEDHRPVYVRFFTDKDDALRAAAAEGYARLKNPADRPMLAKAFSEERKQNPRLGIAFALVAAGDREYAEFSALRYLVNTLNLKAWRGVARAYLVELSLASGIRLTLYPVLATGTKDEKSQLCQVLAMTGDDLTLRYLESLASDTDTGVAQEALKAVRALKARL
jgi:HEAT repeat protein